MVLIAILAAVLFTGPPAWAQSESDELPEVTVSFSVVKENAAEGKTTSVGIQLNDFPKREVVIPITVTNRGGATSDDYSGVPSSVTFDSDDNYKVIRFAATEDSDDDGESVQLGIGSPLPAGVSLGEFLTTTLRNTDGGEVYVGLAQVGVGVAAHLRHGNRRSPLDNEEWQWQRSATGDGAYSDIPATEGGTSNPYTPLAGDLGMWLKAKVTYDISGTGKTAQAIALQPVLSQAALSNAGQTHDNLLGLVFSRPVTHQYAQGFTTGPDTRGYRLLGVRLSLFSNRDTADGTWAVHADDAGKPAAAPLSAARPILDADLDDGDDRTFEEFTHPDGVDLQPDTKYWIVISQTTPIDDGIIGVGVLSDFSDNLPLVEGFDPDLPLPAESDPNLPLVVEKRNFCNPSQDLSSERLELCTPPVDPGSEEGWSINIPVLVYYWDDPNDPDDVPLLPELLPWQLIATAMQFPEKDRFVLRMSLVVAPEVTVQFTHGSYTVAEGGTQSVTVTLSADPERTVTIPITKTGEGGATSSDYSASSSVTFIAGEISKTFDFTATQDTLDDDDESVKLGFGTMPDAWVSAGTTDETTVSITDDDDPEVTVMFGQATYTVDESDDTSTTGVTENTVEVTLTLSADPERTVAIPIETTELDGATGADYSVPSSVTFNDGETSKSFVFTATHDTVDDDGERVRLSFGTPPDRVSEGARYETTVGITDDDDPFVTVQFGQASQGVGEGETVNVTITLSANPERTVTIPITSTGQSGASSADYSVPANVTFNDGETEKTIAFMATEDEVDDDNESVKLGFGSSLPARVSTGTRTETTLNIGDDDDPVVTVMFAQTTHTVDEGGTQQVTVSVSADPERTIIIPIVPTHQGTASAADYSGVPPSVTFVSGDTSESFTFTATQDVIDDDGEGVKLGFGTMPDPRVSAGTRDEVTVNINDDDTADIVLSSTSLTVTEEDASGASYTVALATEPTVDVTVTISGHAGTDLNLEGIRLSNDALTFTADNWSRPQTVTVAAGHDDDGVNDDETLTHTAAGGEYAGPTSDLPVTVNDNDPLGISINPLELTVEESDSASYGVSLATEPTVEVTVAITGHAGTDLTLSGSTLSGDALTFTSSNWNTPQMVTVTAGHDENTDDDTETLTHTSTGGEYAGLTRALPVIVDDNTGDLRLVDGVLTDPGNGANPSEGRLEVFYDGEWCTVCDDYWNEEEADVACRQIGFVGGSVEDWDRFRNSFFPPGAEDQTIALDDVTCTGSESELAECRNRGWGRANCNHNEDVGVRCIRNSEGPYITGMEISGPPGSNDLYDVGETVTVTVTWSEAVNVEVTPTTGIHTPYILLQYGSPYAPNARAVYASGSGATSTVFSAEVQDRGDAPYSRIDVYHESLTTEIWNATPGQDPVGSFITSAGTGKPAILGHGPFRGPESGQQVEATTITGTPAFNDPGADGVFGPGEAVEVTFTFNRPVNVDATGGTPSAPVLLGGTTERDALYLRGSGASQLVFGYTLINGDGVHSSLLVDPNALALNGGAIRDAANNLDADISHQGGGAIFVPVVESDTAAPQLQSATVDGSTLTLTYNEDLDTGVTPPADAFAVTVNGASRSIIGVGVGESSVVLFPSPAVEAGDTVTVAYTVPTGESPAGLQDVSGNAAESFRGQAVTNNTASTEVERSDSAPAPGVPNSLKVAGHESGKLLASWNAPDSGATPTGYTLQWKQSADDWNEADDVSEASVKGTSHAITGLTDGVQYAVLVIAYKGGASGDPSGEVTATPQETVAPSPSATSVDGATLTITFNEPLDTGGVPDKSAFSVTVAGSGRGVDTLPVSGSDLTVTLVTAALAGEVTVAGSGRGVDTVSVSGSDVTITLVTAALAGEVVTVGYTAPSGESAARLQDVVGNAAASFSGREATNTTQAAAPFTASVSVVPESHDGSTVFTFELRFSETPRKRFSYKIMRDLAFTVTGGEVTGARRLVPRSDVGWEIRVRPDGNGPVTIVLPVTTDCTAEGAICTNDRRPLSNRLEITVPGPGG